MSDIIDNRNFKLVEQINTMLDSTESARFAVGYFFLSGFTAIAHQLAVIKELCLLIGNTSNRETIEQLAEGYQRLELVADKLEAEAYRKRKEAENQAQETLSNIAEGIAVMDQTDEGEFLINALVRMIEEKRLKVHIYTKGRLHAKAYIFTYGTIYDERGKPLMRNEKGIGVVGSSNLTLSGITHNTELNVVVHGNDNHEQLCEWFDALWEESEPFDMLLMNEMKESWAAAQTRPYDIYMKTLYTLVRERIEGGDEKDILWEDEVTRELADFQKVAVRQAIQLINDYGGGFVADVVGLGKSRIGAAIVKHFERTRRARALILCPAPLKEMWDEYNEKYELNAHVMSMGLLREDDARGIRRLLDDPLVKDRDFILIDESHNLRNPNTQRYRLLQAYLSTGGRRCCFLTATPRNKSAWDVYNQIKLFHPDDRTDLPIDPPHLRNYFKLIDDKQRKLPDVLSHILVRRTRNHILRWYGFDSETHEPVDPGSFQDYLDYKRHAYVIVGGKHQFFPRRELETIDYSIEDTYEGFYQQLRGFLGKPGQGHSMTPIAGELTFARYGLWRYVLPAKQRQEPYASLQRAGANLRGLIRILLFKRLESSVYAFCQTVKGLIRVHRLFVEALDNGIVSAGEKAQRLLYESDEEDLEAGDLLEALEKVAGQYNVDDFDVDRLHEHIEHDIDLMESVLARVEAITPENDAKLQTLKVWLEREPLKSGKQLIFTQYTDTARYLSDNLNPGGNRQDIEVIYSGKSKMPIVGRFAPKANPKFRVPNASELMTLIATDVLSEGLNLQDCNVIINYDLHWNPVRLIQRFGRIDRIGSEHDKIFAYNFLPETGIERNLGLRQKLHNRIQEIHDTIGEDALILDKTEQLNTDAMYAIYERNGGKLSQLEMEDDEDLLDINEAEELMRQLRRDDPAEYERIANLRDGIRAAKSSSQKGTFIFCRAGRYQQLFLVDEAGNIVSRDIPRVLGAIKCSLKERALSLPKDHNRAIMQIRQLFGEEAKHRLAERDSRLSLSTGQRYIIRELGVLFRDVDDEDAKARINLLERTFRKSVSSAVNRELNLLRRNSVSGVTLLDALSSIFLEHNLQYENNRQQVKQDNENLARIVCSEALV